MATGDKTPRNGHDDPDFADRLKPSKFTGPVRGGGLAGQPPAGDDSKRGCGLFLIGAMSTVALGVAEFASRVWPS